MNTQQGSNSVVLKILVALLGLGVLGLGYKTYNLYNEKKEVKQILQQEKEQVINELEDLKVNYDQALQEKTEVSDKLQEAKTRIESLIQEVKKEKKISASLIHKYKKEIRVLKAQRDELYKIADSLRLANQTLVVQKDSLQTNLDKQIQYTDTLVSKNEKLAKVIDKAKMLYPTNIKASGVKIRSSGKVIETSRRRRAQQIRVCFTVPKNDILAYGNQKLYIKVVNPEGVVIGDNQTVSFDGNDIVYSAVQDFVYDNQALDVCTFVKPKDKKKEIIKGNYDIKIYYKGNEVGSTTLILK